MQIKYSDKSVLLVEHDQDALSLLKHSVGLLGFSQVYTASSVNMALSMMRAIRFDLCIAGYDLAKDEKVGLQLLQEAREEGIFSHKSIFLLVLESAKASLLKSALEFAPDSFITYPADPPKLRTRLDKLWRVKLVTAQIEGLRDEKEFGKAVRVCDFIAKKYPGLQIYVERLKGVTLLQAKRVQDAQLAFAELAKRPTLSWAKVGAGIAYYQAGEYKAAQRMLQQVIDGQQMGVEVFLWIAKAQLAQGLDKQALNMLRKAVMLQPSISLLQLALGEVAEQQSQWRLALESYDQALKYAQNSVYQRPELYLAVINATAYNFEGQSVEKWRLVELDIVRLTEGLLQSYDGHEEVSLWSKLVLVHAFKAANAVEKSAIRAQEAWAMFEALDVSQKCAWLGTLEHTLVSGEWQAKLGKQRNEINAEVFGKLPVWYELSGHAQQSLANGDIQKAFVQLRKSYKESDENAELCLQVVDTGAKLVAGQLTSNKRLIHDCERLLFGLSYAGLDFAQKAHFSQLKQRYVTLRQSIKSD